MKKITTRAVTSLTLGELIWDPELKRFDARCRANGVTYLVKARFDGGQRWLTLGRHGPLTTAEARLQAKKVLAEIDSGKDPARVRDEMRKLPMFSSFTESWLSEHVKTSE